MVTNNIKDDSYLSQEKWYTIHLNDLSPFATWPNIGPTYTCKPNLNPSVTLTFEYHIWQDMPH
jgi:hypothetical protein